jgi:hypothetical protein
MSSKNILFPAGSSSTTTYPSVADAGEISLRDEFESITLGTGGDVPKGIPLLIRKMRRNSDESLVTCTACVDELTKEPHRDFPCPYCLGAGVLWDEYSFVGYRVISPSPTGSNAAANLPKTARGESYMPSARFYLPWDIDPTREDRIVEIELDIEGDVVMPINRIGVYQILLIRDIRGDNGRIEY